MTIPNLVPGHADGFTSWKPPESSTTERFAALFTGRTDAYGTEEGGCARVEPTTDWSWIFDMHLNGANPIGVYPLVWRAPVVKGEVDGLLWFVKWGCIDLDVKGPTHATGYETADDALVAARNLVTALRALDVTGWIERTRSGGFHVWVFAADWVPAATMRRALLVACGLVGVPPTEVNPKAEGYDHPDTLGNYVRLPYPGALPPPGVDIHGKDWAWQPTGNRTALDPEQGYAYLLYLEDFLSGVEQSLAPTTTLESAAALWTPPVIAHEETVEFVGEVVLDETLRKRLGGLTYTILTQGPLDGGDRSGALFKLAHCCKDDDLTAAEALAVVTAADLAWGKYHRRHDGERQLRRTVERAYA